MSHKEQLKKLIASAIVASIILGGLAGGVVSTVLWSLSNVRPVLPLAPTQPSNGGQTSILEEETRLEKDTVTVVKEALPAVVSIIATQELQLLPQSSFFDDFFFQFPFEMSPFPQRQQQEAPQTERRQVSSGSGFIVRDEGLIVTNRHVVLNEEAEYSVVLSSGETYDAKVIDRDSIQDLAIVQIIQKDGEKKTFSTLPLGDSNEVVIGQTVIAIGNTLGEFRNTVTRGIVSGINRTLTAGGIGIQSELIEGAIQTDAAISSGNSGGPLLNLKGEVIGVNTAVSQEGENIGFALPISQVTMIIESIEKYGEIVRPFLGVRYILLNEDIAKKNTMDISEGALIIRGEAQDDFAVIRGSPADKAGLRENDIIIEVDGKKVDAEHSLQRLLAGYNVGDRVKLKVYRGGEIMEKDITLENRED